MNGASRLYSKLVRHRRQLIVMGSVIVGGTVVREALVTLQDEEEEDNYNYDSNDFQTNLSRILLSKPLTTTATTATSTTACSANVGSDPSGPSELPIPTRQEQLKRLKKGGEVFDVLVVGGGATGSGAALDATMRGLSTVLIDKGDFGTETSSRSTKLIWAGIKYIATAFSSLLRFKNLTQPTKAFEDFYSEFKMVLGAHQERKILLEQNEHLTNWVPIAIPFNSWLTTPPPFKHPIFVTTPLVAPAVMKLYDSMSGFTCPPSHVMGKRRAHRKFPQLDQHAKYFQIFYEGQHNDARTNTCIALTAAQEGATIANYVEMIGLVTDPKTGKATGITCKDKMSGEKFVVKAKAIVFAGGPFTDSLRNMEDKDSAPAVAAAAGTHIVLPSYFCPGGIGMLDINTSDGRFLFFLPWEGHTLVGTTDRKEPAVSDYGPPEEEILWLLHEVQKYLAGNVKVRRSDVLSAWQGYRPLASDPHAPPGAPVSRDHVISTNPTTGVTFITGGKWTTYREMAEDVIDRILGLHPELKEKGVKPCGTKTRPLLGGVGYDRNLPIRLVQEFNVSEASAKHLAHTYGMNALEVCRMATPTSKRWPRFGKALVEGFPYLECEIPYVCRHEMAVTVKDVLTLRTRLAFLNKDAAVAAAPKIAELMAKELNWSRREQKRQLQEAMDALASFGGTIPNKDWLEHHETRLKSVREVFEAMDLDKTGYIDLTNFMDACEMLGIPFSSWEKAKKVFQTIDRDNNGKIDENEFVDWWYHSNSQLKSQLADKFKFTAASMGGGILG